MTSEICNISKNTFFEPTSIPLEKGNKACKNTTSY